MRMSWSVTLCGLINSLVYMVFLTVLLALPHASFHEVRGAACRPLSLSLSRSLSWNACVLAVGVRGCVLGYHRPLTSDL